MTIPVSSTAGQPTTQPNTPTNEGVGTIYILQFSKPLGGLHHQARYYIGYSKLGTADARLADHRCGKGAAITRAANERQIRYDIICTLEGDRNTERALKNIKNTPRILRQIRRGTFTAAKVTWFGWTD